MLKSNVDTLDDVPEVLREHYVPRGSGGFRLETDEEASKSLHRALEFERQKRKDAEARLLEVSPPAAAKADDEPEWWTASGVKDFVQKNLHRLNGLEGEARAAEFTKIQEEASPLIDAYTRAPYEAELKHLREEYVRIRGDVEANTLAAKLAVAGSASALAPFIRERIQVERSGEDDWAVTYRDATGATVTPDVLEFEFRNNAAMAPLFPGNTAREREVHDRKVAETLGRHAGAVKR